MSHHISGIIFKKELHQDWDGVCHVDLPHGYVLVPNEGDIAAKYDPSSKWSSDDLMDDISIWRNRVTAVIAKHIKTFASISTDYFGGMGEQEGKAWVDGTRVVSGDSINDALVAIGVVREPNMDEFDTVSLGSYRDSDDITSEWKVKMGVKDGLEIERKFLLRKIPKHDLLPKNVEELTSGMNGFLITQMYVQDGEDKFRIRRIIDRSKADNLAEAVKYVVTRKQQLRPGVYAEQEHPIQMVEFAKHTQNAFKQISKVRYEVPHNELTWEIDIFEHMIVAEIELPSEDWTLEIPDFIKDVMVMEVTDIKQFTNFNLADAIK